MMSATKLFLAAIILAFAVFSVTVSAAPFPDDKTNQIGVRVAADNNNIQGEISGKTRLFESDNQRNSVDLHGNYGRILSKTPELGRVDAQKYGGGLIWNRETGNGVHTIQGSVNAGHARGLNIPFESKNIDAGLGYNWESANGRHTLGANANYGVQSNRFMGGPWHHSSPNWSAGLRYGFRFR